MSEYDLIAFDMDGTLLNDSKEITSITIDAISRACAAGKQVVLCTGRPVSEIEPYRNVLPSLRYYIAVSGAFIWDCFERRALRCHVFAPEIVDVIAGAMEREDIMPDVMSENTAYLQADQIALMEHYHMESFRPLYSRYNQLVPDIRTVIQSCRDRIEKINFYHADPQARQRSRERLKEYPIAMENAESTSLELSPRGVTKGAGLTELSELLDIPMERVIAVGDADNDLPMIGAAGLGLAMGNSNPRVLAAADEVLPDNEHDGCAAAIERFLLN